MSGSSISHTLTAHLSACSNVVHELQVALSMACKDELLFVHYVRFLIQIPVIFDLVIVVVMVQPQ